MKKLKFIIFLIFFCALALTINAQEWTKEQQEIWNAIDNTWELTKDKEDQYFIKILHPDCLGWNNTTPMPRNKKMTTRWSNFYKDRSVLLEYQLFPMGIIVKDNLAIAHYYYLTVSEIKDGKTETERGRWTDTWYKEGDKWLLLAWQGGKDK